MVIIIGIYSVIIIMGSFPDSLPSTCKMKHNCDVDIGTWLRTWHVLHMNNAKQTVSCHRNAGGAEMTWRGFLEDLVYRPNTKMVERHCPCNSVIELGYTTFLDSPHDKPTNLHWYGFLHSHTWFFSTPIFRTYSSGGGTAELSHDFEGQNLQDSPRCFWWYFMNSHPK